VIFQPEKNLFLAITSTNINTLVPPLYQCVQTRSIKYCCLSHFRTWSGIICDFRAPLREFLDPVVNRFKRLTLPTQDRKYSFMNILCNEFFCPQRKQKNAALRYYTPQARWPFLLFKLPFEHGHAHLISRLSWSWTVLLPSVTYRKPDTSITAVSLPFLSYLLTLPRIFQQTT
jgi:hypothetical protein